ncbi:MAG: RNA polymerase sigma factor [Solirubrobacteraceae bacterium]
MDTQLSVAAPSHSGASPLPLKLLSDERLARLVGAGSERAFAVLYERHHQPLYRYCRSMLRHDADAQDALQSAMAGAFAALKREQRDAPLRPWLYRIAHNEAISVLRRRRPEAELSDLAEAPGGSVEDQVDGRARLSQLVADMRELPERQRAALLMRELNGLSHEEISLALETSVGNAKQTIFEARHSLLEFVEGRAMACEAIRRTLSDGDGRALRGRRVRAHLRECASCATFAAGISERRSDLRALAPPLPAFAATGLLARLLGGGSGHGGGAGGLAAGAAGKGVGGALLAKSAVSAAVVITAAAGATVAIKHETRAARHSSPARTAASPVVSGVPARSGVRSNTTAARHAATARPHGRAGDSAQGAVTVRKATLAVTRDASRPAKALRLPGSSRHTPATSNGRSATTSHGTAANPGGTGPSAHFPQVAGAPTSTSGGKPAITGLRKPTITARAKSTSMARTMRRLSQTRTAGQIAN